MPSFHFPLSPLPAPRPMFWSCPEMFLFSPSAAVVSFMLLDYRCVFITSSSWFSCDSVSDTSVFSPLPKQEVTYRCKAEICQSHRKPLWLTRQKVEGFTEVTRTWSMVLSLWCTDHYHLKLYFESQQTSFGLFLKTLHIDGLQVSGKTREWCMKFTGFETMTRG